MLQKDVRGTFLHGSAWLGVRATLFSWDGNQLYVGDEK